MLTVADQEFIRETVARTAAVMDDVRPGWYANVDTDSLSIDSPFQCIVGQVWPQAGFTKMYAGTLRPRFEAEYGPDEQDAWCSVSQAGPDVDTTSDEIAYTEFCWREELDARWEADSWLTEVCSQAQEQEAVEAVQRSLQTPRTRLVALPTR